MSKKKIAETNALRVANAASLNKLPHIYVSIQAHHLQRRQPFPQQQSHRQKKHTRNTIFPLHFIGVTIYTVRLLCALIN